MTALKTVIGYLNENKEKLANDLVDTIIDKFGFEVPEQEVEQAKGMYVEFLGFLAVSIGCEEGSVPESLVEWSKANGERAASAEGKISSILIRYPDTRLVFADWIVNIGIQHGLSTEEVVLVLKRVNHMLDLSINETVFAFERRNDQMLKDAQREINQLASPIVPIREGLAVLPLIGSVDTDRAEHLLNTVVPKITEQKIRSLIIDFSGIITIDTYVARHVFTIYDVLRLLGIEVIFTGIRPELATRIVSGGINFSSFNVYATVKQAIESI